ncbi:MAG: hypothetical protein K2J77_05715, partial [Oscillospiraceae bacterium]|nr:hypothetical protein [Oscillospiraceae bacterium]
MRFKKAIAAGVAACVMTASAASLVKSVSALSAESPAAAVDVTVELVGVTDDYAARVPLSVVLDNMMYAHDVFAETAPDDNESETPGVSESEPGDTSTDVSELESEPAETSEPESEPAEESAPEAAEAPTADEEVSKPESEPADITNIPEEEVPEAASPDNENSEIPEDNEEPGASEEAPEAPEPLHKRGDKVELPDGAEFVWVDGEQYSIGDKNATLNLFVEGSADKYIVEKTLIIGTQAENTVYNATFGITKNRWTFDTDFELYTTNSDGEKTMLNAALYDIGVNSVKYLITSEVGERDVYLKLSPRFMRNGEIAEDVTVDVIYRGTNPVDSRILADGGIIVDLLAFDAEHNLITEQREVAITAAAGTLRLGAALDYNTEASLILDAACAIDFAELAFEIDESFFGEENSDPHTIIIGSLSAGAFELSEDDVLKAALGRFNSLDEALDAEDNKSALFGEGLVLTVDNCTELTLFIEQGAIFGISAGEEPLAAHVRFMIKDKAEAPEIPEEPTIPKEPEEPGDDPEQPIIPEIPQEPETVELN